MGTMDSTEGTPARSESQAEPSVGTGDHVVLGTGPVGCWLARTLRQQGVMVRSLNRSGRRPALLPDDVTVSAVDVTDIDATRAAVGEAAVVYQALNPPYHRWQQEFPSLQRSALTAAADAGAVYVSIDNLYAYGHVTGPISEASAERPSSTKGNLRASMTAEVRAAHDSGRVRAAILRSSDYYGPGVTQSSFGERAVRPLTRGKRAEVLGSANQPHSYAYVEDVATAAVRLATTPKTWGQVWITPHAPAITQGAMVEVAAAEVGAPSTPKVLSPRMVKAVGLFSPTVRELVEMLYEFTGPFVVDSSHIEQTLGLQPTPLTDGLRRTVSWYSTT